MAIEFFWSERQDLNLRPLDPQLYYTLPHSLSIPISYIYMDFATFVCKMFANPSLDCSSGKTQKMMLLSLVFRR